MYRFGSKDLGPDLKSWQPASGENVVQLAYHSRQHLGGSVSQNIERNMIFKEFN